MKKARKIFIEIFIVRVRVRVRCKGPGVCE